MAARDELEIFADLIEAGEVDAATQVLDRNPELLDVPLDGADRALHLACAQNHLEIVRLLVGRGANVNARGETGRTALHYTALDGDENADPIGALLLGAGADPNAIDAIGRTPLDQAVTEAMDELEPFIQRLLDAGARVTLSRPHSCPNFEI